MNESNWLKIKEVFNQTLDLSEAERNDLLSTCDESIRSEVVELLKSYSESENFISQPAVVEFGLSEDRLIGKIIGDYKILKEIGEGGMGKVYLASRDGFEQNFAIKLIKRGMDTDAVLKRFVRERQILSRLEHPNIARLLNVGSTDDGLPYFVMEYIEGQSITTFCDAQKYTVGEKLELFRKVCDAVRYAHQNLVVHRDIKPSNIMVSADGIPKLLDFGIAKLLNNEELDATAFQAGMLTPEYASPEQMKNLPITTATDVYSLGIVLYQLNTGTRPYRFNAPNNGTSESLVNKKTSINSDLKNIIDKAIRDEADRRYQTVQEFSEDIRRFILGLPVSATSDSKTYRISKFIRRNRKGVLIGSAIGLLFLIISGVAIWQGIVAIREQAKAERRFEQVRKLANIVLFEYHDSIAPLPGATQIREKMLKDSLEFLDSLTAESSDNLDLQRDIVKAYRKIGDIQGGFDTGNTGKTQEGLQSYEKALNLTMTINQKYPGNIADRLMQANLLIDIGLLIRSTGNFKDAEIRFENSKEILELLSKEQPNTIEVDKGLAKLYWNVGNLKTAKNDLDSSLENYARAINIFEDLAVRDSGNSKHLRNVALTNKNIGSVLLLRGEDDRAMEHFQKSLAIDSENAKNRPNDVSAQLDLSFTIGTVASAQRKSGELQKSIENYRLAVEIREKIFSADPKNVFAETALASGYEEIGRTYLISNNLKDADKNFRHANAIFEKISVADPGNVVKQLDVSSAVASIGYVAGLQRNLVEAERLFRESLAVYKELHEQKKLTILDLRRLAAVYLDFAEILIKNSEPKKAFVEIKNGEKLLEDQQISKDAKEEISKLKKLLVEFEKY